MLSSADEGYSLVGMQKEIPGSQTLDSSELAGYEGYYTGSAGVSNHSLFALTLSWLAVASSCFADVVTMAPGDHHAWLTVPQEFALSQTQSNLVRISFYLGWLLGDILFGFLANRTGRVPALAAGLLGGGICGSFSALAPTWQSLAGTRFLAGVFLGGADLVAYVLLCELCLPHERSRGGCWMQSVFAVGIAWAGLSGCMVLPWRTIYLLTAALPALFTVPLFLWVPESPEWLDEMSGKQEEETSEALVEHGSEPCLKLLGVLALLWFTTGLTYFAMTTSAGVFSPHLAINLVLLGLVEIPSYIIAASVLEVLGRRDGCILFCALQTCVCGLNFLLNHAALTNADTLAQVPLAILAKGLCSSLFGTLWILTPELFLTATRSIALAICSQCARLGSMAMPFVLSTMRSGEFIWMSETRPVTHASSLAFFFGATATFSAILLVMLPPNISVAPKAVKGGHVY